MLQSVQVYLASKSPRRAELLQQIGVDYIQLSGDIDESPLANEQADHYVLRLAREKALALWQHASRKQAIPLLSADTCISLDDKILAKPSSLHHASEMLQQLSGRTHQVLTAVALYDGKSITQKLSITDVSFKRLSQQEVIDYLNTGEPMGKAGSYAIQGYAAVFIRSIKGSYSGVMGLPLYETAELLNEYGKTK